MQQLGQYLKLEREKRGIRLEEIASSTKINIQNLILIEEDRWNELPQEPFIRGFITAYAKYLGLNPQEILNRFYQSQKTEETSSEISDDPSEVPTPHISSPPQTKTNDFSSKTPDSSAQLKRFNFETPKQVKGVALFLLFVLILGFAVTRLIDSSRENDGGNPPLTSSTLNSDLTATTNESSTSSSDPNASSTTVSTEQVASSTTTSTLVQPTTTTVTTVTTKPTTTTAPAPTPTNVTVPQNTPAASTSATVPPQPSGAIGSAEEGHTVSVSIKYRTWSKLVIDDQAPVETYLEPGSQVTYQAKSKIKLVLGNSTSSLVTYNGQENKGKKYSGTIRYYIFPKGARFPQDKPKKKESDESSSENEGIPVQDTSGNKESE